MEKIILDPMILWGYRLLPKVHPHSPGYTGLEVALQPEPTCLHYDPEAIGLRLQESDQVTWTTLTLTSPLREMALVCPGRVTLHDRVDKRVDFFVFGATLTGQAASNKIIYQLESPAPVLQIVNRVTALVDQFAVQIELMLGMFRARWGTDDRGFAQRLVRLEPLQFYIASLEAVLLRCQRSCVQTTYHNLCAILRREKEWLQATGQWPAQPLTLSKLFEVD